MLLRDYKKDDSAIICKWIRTEDELYKWSADRFNKFPLLANDIDDNYSPQIEGGRFFPLTAIDDEENMIGHFIIRYPIEDDDNVVRFGFVIVAPELRENGYGKEMLRLGVQYVRDKLNVSRIDLGVFENNDGAKRCYEAIGFREYGRREYKMPIGTWKCFDMEMLLRDELGE